MSDWIKVSVAATKGSVPRDAGTHMLVFADDIDGTIGGGALEWSAIHSARQMLSDGQNTQSQTIPLGPDLGQCCGGSVTLDFERGGTDQRQLGTPLWIWGAGHVGRAIMGVMAALEDRTITLIDTTTERMPRDLPPIVAPFVAADPVRAVVHAPKDADHLILTYSHDIDLALCDALLRRGFGTCGLIGSATKWARFRGRLSSMGHEADQITRITCPIGNPTVGKHPQAIAVGVAAGLLSASALNAATKVATGGET